MKYGSKSILMLACLLTIVVGCGKKDDSSVNGQDATRPDTDSGGSGVRLRIVSGSENKSLQPMIEQYARSQGANVEIDFMGSVDISRQIAMGISTEYDAVWPASSLWIAMGDTQHVIKHAESILRSPVIFAVKKSVAQRLGWIGRAVSVREILDAAQARTLRFAMTSATQSNSGASAYLGYLSAFAGNPDVLTSAHLDSPDVREKIRQFLHSINRSSGSSGWLMEMMLSRYNDFDAMVNYEALAIEANRTLVQRGDEPLYVVYPVDGLTIADSPLGYVDKGDAAKEALFRKLQAHLLSRDIQQHIQSLGRRTGSVGVNMGVAEPSVFNPDWGIDLSRILAPVPTPSGPVVQDALMLYQTALRKPSLTAFVLDFSGSMRGRGEEQLKLAMRTLLDQELAKQFLLQSSPDDLTFVIPFNNSVIATWQAKGSDPDQMRQLLINVEEQPAGGGTDMYTPAALAIKLLQDYDQSGKYHSSIIIMSDGKSQHSIDSFETAVTDQSLSRDIPIYTILFGDASEDQMKSLAERMSGRMFDGRKDVVGAFREAKGYN